jgi:hypothetical protein
MKRYFKKKERQLFYSFWEITVLANSITERFGTHGTPGSSRPTICQSDASAMHRAQHMIDAKQMKEGYREVTPVPVLGPWYGEVDSETYERFLECLEKCAKGPPEEYFFNPPASSQTIAALEAECQITLPDSLRSFLSYCNGGFIWRAGSLKRFQIVKEQWPEENEASLKREVSFPFYSAEEICHWYKHGSEYGYGPGIIPFCETGNGEVLIVWSMTHPYQESPVFDAFHEEAPPQWKQVYATFAHLFIDYVENRGNINMGGNIPGWMYP